MINVSVAQDYCFQIFGSKWKRVPVPLVAFRPALNQSTIQKKTTGFRFDSVTRSGDLSGGSMERDVQLGAPF